MWISVLSHRGVRETVAIKEIPEEVILPLLCLFKGKKTTSPQQTSYVFLRKKTTFTVSVACLHWSLFPSSIQLQILLASQDFSLHVQK